MHPSRIFFIFPDDTNLFYSHLVIKELFQFPNSKLRKVCNWSNAHKLSLNEGKTKYIFFHGLGNRNDIPLKLQTLFVNKSQFNK